MDDYEETISTSLSDIEQTNDVGESEIDPKVLGLGATALVVVGGLAWAKREAIREKVRSRREKKLEKKKARLAKKLANLKVVETPEEEAETE